MPKSIMLGNGAVLVGLDGWGQIKDLYYHYPGLENHVSEAFTHKIGVFVDSTFSWVDDGNWTCSISAKPRTLIGNVVLKSDRFGLEITFTDCVYNEKNIFIREICVKNLFERSRKVKLFLNAQFDISQVSSGETAFYDPRERVIIHYKGRRVFLINLIYKNSGFDQYSVGLLGIEGKSGTYMDAQDGELSGNAIEHGQVDSVVGVNMDISSKSTEKFHYYICIAKSVNFAKKLNDTVLSKTPEQILKSTQDYWKAWVGVRNFNFYRLEISQIELFEKSLLYVRSHTAKNGAIIASGDSEMLQFGRDYYEYVWPRDGVFSAISLAKAGDINSSRLFFDFCSDVISPEGFYFHKYRPDKSVGSSWHPWIRNGQAQLPIQEDETAIVVWGLWEYYAASRDLEFIESIYNKVIKKASDFMVSYTDDKTGLPRASYDLWERVYGINTYTSAAVYGALEAAGRFAKLLGKNEAHKLYSQASKRIKKAILKYLYDKDMGLFYKLITTDKDRYIDKTLDFSSFFGIYKFGVLDISDPRLEILAQKTTKALWVDTQIGGYSRFEGDSYHHPGGNIPGNPWIITNLWLAQYFVDTAKNIKNFDRFYELIKWTVSRANPANILPEQVNGYTGEHLSASPLTWSHAEYIVTIIKYLEKLERLGISKAYNLSGFG